jgi:hypothetical protein
MNAKDARDALIERDLEVLLRGESAPDLTPETLQRAGQQEDKPAQVPRARKWSGVSRRRFAEAALVALAVALIALVVARPTQAPRDEPEQLWVAGPESVVVETESGLLLERGWLLLLPGAPDVTSGESSLTKIRGWALAHAQGRPSEEDWQSIQTWLYRNQVEEEMLKGKNWAQGLAMAVLLFAGTAVLDGQEVEAPEAPDAPENEEAPAEPAWHVVRSVMDIENLPADARYVDCSQLQGAHLEFLVRHKQMEGLSLSGIEGLHPQHIAALAALESLSYLNLQDSGWVDEVDYRPLTQLKALRTLKIDFIPQHEKGGMQPAQRAQRANTSNVVGELSDAGVEIHLKGMQEVTTNMLVYLIRRASGVVEMDLTGAHISDADMKVVAELERLQSLTAPQIGELGLAFLAAKNRLRALHVDVFVTRPVLHQLVRMTNLEELTTLRFYDYEDEYVPAAEAIEALTVMKNLRVISMDYDLQAEDVRRFQAFARLQELRYVPDRSTIEDVCTLLRGLASTGVRQLEIRAPLRLLVVTKEELTESEAAALADLPPLPNLVSLRLVTPGHHDESLTDEQVEALKGESPIFLDLLAKAKNLESLEISGRLTPQMTKLLEEYAERHLKRHLSRGD